jgi:hypothetical protein
MTAHFVFTRESTGTFAMASFKDGQCFTISRGPERWGVSRDWGDRDGIDITDRPLAGLGTANGAGVAEDRPLCLWFPAVAGHC